MSTHFDCIVVGAGIEGSSTAYWLAKNGVKTLLLDKFPIPHTRGSSHGESRIARIVYARNKDFIPIMHECYTLWHQLEQEVGYKLMRQTGRLHVGRRNENVIAANVKAMDQYNLPYQLLSAEQINAKYPQLHFDQNWEGFFDPTSAVLYANKCLSAFQGEFLKNGGVIHGSEPVQSIWKGKTHIRVKTTKNVYAACYGMAICVGPWAKTFCKQLGLDLPIQPEYLPSCYWSIQKEGAYSVDGGFPILNISDRKYGHYFGTPEDEYPGMFKLCCCEGIELDNPDDRDNSGTVEARRKVELMPAEHISRYMKYLSETPAIVEQCIQTVSPDGSPIIGPHPDHKNIIIAAGFTGHGFKLAPYVGKLTAALASGKNPVYPDSFKLTRFSGGCRLKNKL